jgi:hypothetical protein
MVPDMVEQLQKEQKELRLVLVIRKKSVTKVDRCRFSVVFLNVDLKIQIVSSIKGAAVPLADLFFAHCSGGMVGMIFGAPTPTTLLSDMKIFSCDESTTTDSLPALSGAAAALGDSKFPFTPHAPSASDRAKIARAGNNPARRMTYKVILRNSGAL